MTEFLFLGGSKHGQHIELGTFKNLIYFPIPPKIDWISEEDDIDISFQSDYECYKKRTIAHFSGNIGKHFYTPKDWTHSESLSNLRNHLFIKWLEEDPQIFTEPPTKASTEISKLLELIPGLRSMAITKCPFPVCWNKLEHDIQGWIVHLNDYHRCTFEEIASWLDSLKGVDLSVKPKRSNS